MNHLRNKLSTDKTSNPKSNVNKLTFHPSSILKLSYPTKNTDYFNNLKIPQKIFADFFPQNFFSLIFKFLPKPKNKLEPSNENENLKKSDFKPITILGTKTI